MSLRISNEFAAKSCMVTIFFQKIWDFTTRKISEKYLLISEKFRQHIISACHEVIGLVVGKRTDQYFSRSQIEPIHSNGQNFK